MEGTLLCLWLRLPLAQCCRLPVLLWQLQLVLGLPLML